MITARGLAKRFGAKRIFDGLDFEVERGGFVLVTGPNGSGKTTLLRLAPTVTNSAPSAMLSNTLRSGSSCSRI